MTFMPTGRATRSASCSPGESTFLVGENDIERKLNPEPVGTTDDAITYRGLPSLTIGLDSLELLAAAFELNPGSPTTWFPSERLPRRLPSLVVASLF
jgi:hypothetical protein